jgi:hypothetical protein
MVVIPPPEMQLATSVGQGEEDFHVQALVPQLAVETIRYSRSRPACQAG